MYLEKSQYSRPKAKVSKKRLKHLMAQTNGRCAYCGIVVVYPKRGSAHEERYDRRITATTDHVVPLKKGGKHVLENMVCSCLGCNASKNDRSLEEFRVNLFHRMTNIPVFSSAQIAWLEENGFPFPDRYVAFFFEEIGFFLTDTGLVKRG